MWCWRKTEKISWTDCVRNWSVTKSQVEEEYPTYSKRRKGNWIGHILRRNFLLKHVIEEKIEGRIEVKWRRGRRRKQVLDDLKKKTGYWKLKQEALTRTLWRTRFGSVYGHVARHTRLWLMLFFVCTTVWASGESQDKALATEAASVSPNIFTHCNPQP